MDPRDRLSASLFLVIDFTVNCRHAVQHALDQADACSRRSRDSRVETVRLQFKSSSVVMWPPESSTTTGIQRRGIGRRSCLTSDGQVRLVLSAWASFCCSRALRTAGSLLKVAARQ